MNLLNAEFLPTVRSWKNDICGAIEGNVRYHKISEGNNKIDEENAIVYRYFEELDNGDAICSNGWLAGNWDP